MNVKNELEDVQSGREVVREQGFIFVDVHVQIDRKLCQTTYQVANAVDVQTEHVATTYTDRYMMGPEQDWSGKNDADILAAASGSFAHDSTGSYIRLEARLYYTSKRDSNGFPYDKPTKAFGTVRTDNRTTLSKMKLVCKAYQTGRMDEAGHIYPLVTDATLLNNTVSSVEFGVEKSVPVYSIYDYGGVMLDVGWMQMNRYANIQ